MSGDRTADPNDLRAGDEIQVLRSLLNSDSEQTRLRAAEALLRHRDLVLAAESGNGGAPAITVFAPPKAEPQPEAER